MNTNESNVELEKARNEVYRKVGRNVLLFQHLEQMLKALIAYARVAGYASDLQANIERRRAEVRKKTLGEAVKRFLEDVDPEREEVAEEREERNEIYFSTRLGIEAEVGYLEAKSGVLKSLVDERNELIHHLFSRFNLESVESCKAVEEYLDRQREKVLPEVRELEHLIATWRKIRQEIADFLAFGAIDGRLKAVVFTARAGAVHVISLRKANPREVKRYGQAT